jgi:GT2 family glycosyltransferase
MYPDLSSHTAPRVGPGPGPSVSVVIPTLNRDDSLCNTIRYFLEAETYPFLEVIVIDQSERHEPATAAFLAQGHPKLRHVVVGYESVARARNHGARLATGEIVVFVDDDVEPAEGFLAAHASAYGDSAVVGVTGPILAPGEQPVPRDAIDDEAYRALMEQRRMMANVGFCYSAQWAAGGNVSFRRTLVLALGGYDEVFYGASIGEDAEFAHRVRKRGVIRYLPGAKVIHHHVLTGGTHSAASERGYMRQVGFCVNYFWFRVESPAAERRARVWREFRQRVLNRRTMARGRTVGLVLAFAAGVLESSRVIRRLEQCAPSSSRSN